ncbi:MAG: hypothetical protein EKK41_26825 [Hyphomicrobiales bacterium]|nr:MAG: hypothetical protein EKK41_26825 [Hyphomicrobiales bacterium]
MAKANARLQQSAVTRNNVRAGFLTPKQKALTPGAVAGATLAFADVMRNVPLSGSAIQAKALYAEAWAAAIELGLAQDVDDQRRIRRAKAAVKAIAARCSELERALLASGLDSWNDLVALAIFAVARDAMPTLAKGLEWPGESNGALPRAILCLAGIDPEELFPENARRAA